MTENEKRVFELQKTLPHIDNSDLQETADMMTWWDWDCNVYYSDFIHIGMACGEYQVIRTFDVEMIKHDEDLIDSEETKANWVDDYVTYEDAKLNAEPDDEGKLHLYCYWDENEVCGEFMQCWVNVRTGEVVILGKPAKESEQYCDFDVDWVIVDKDRHSDFYGSFYASVGKKTVHMDWSVHEELYKFGYTEKNILCGDDLNYAEDLEECAFYQIYGCIAEHISKLIQDIGYRRYVDFFGFEGLSFAHIEEYSIALRIAMKHHYEITDNDKWRSYVDKLIEADKDIHNPHYVAPDNLDVAMRHMDHEIELKLRREEKRREEERRERERKEAYEREHAEEIFAELRKPYIGIAWGNDKYDVHIMNSVEEYRKQGEIMHICVGKPYMRYYLKPSSICASVTDKAGGILATVEISLSDFSIIQLRGYCNQVPKGDLEMRKLIKDNVYLLRDAQKNENLQVAV